ncbi:MAG: sulfate ABC transporter substrate-binding protein [Acidobacteria bacterium]|nr:MAG: sulfate ABC transporter substrate-binding protein [Acidobacteriota bacterium]
MRTSAFRNRTLILRASLLFALFALAASSSCLPQPPSNAGGRNITVYGFSIMKEPLEKEIFTAFAAKWKKDHNEEVHFTSSFAGSEIITNQIIQGVDAQVAILSIERDMDRIIQQSHAITSDWRSLPAHGIVNKTPFVIIVRQGNPKGIHDFADLGKPGVQLIHPDPVSSGGAQWSVLAIYGSELIKSEKQTGDRDEARALKTLKAVWKNVFSTPGSAREARTQFELGHGDALITYELEGLLMKQAGAKIEIVVPESTIFSEHPAAIIDTKVKPEDREVVAAFLQYLWSDEAQTSFVKYHFRSATNESLNDTNKEFAQIKLPFYVKDLGGWNKAYPDIIEKIWRDQVQKNK